MNKKSIIFGLFLGCFLNASPALALNAVNVAAQIVDSTPAKQYVSGNNGPDSFDCSGLTWYAFGHLGIQIPVTAATQSTMSSGTLLTSPAVADLQPGDLLFFATDDAKKNVITHVGLYEGNNKMLNALSPEYDLKRSDITSSYWSPRLVSARRLLTYSGSPSTQFSIGDNVEVTEDNVSVRKLRVTSLLGKRNVGDGGTITFGPVRQSLGGTSYWWWKVDFQSGADGWVAEQFLRVVGCVGQVCGTFTPDCNPNIEPCYCFTTAEGGGRCVDNFSCSGAEPCAASADCPTGKACYVDTCCGGSPGVCGPITCTGQTQSSSLSLLLRSQTDGGASAACIVPK